MVRMLLTTVDIPLLVSKIANGEVIEVTDGSFQKELQMGTAAWCLENPSQLCSVSDVAASPGPPSIQNAWIACFIVFS